MSRITVICIVVLIFAAGVAGALESVDAYSGLLWIGNPTFAPASSDGAPTGAPSPILNTYSIAFPFRMGRLFRFAPELGLFGTQYGLIPGFSKTVPVEREYADAIWFLGALVDLDVWLNIPLSAGVDLGFQLGATFLGRIPVVGWGDGWNRLGEMAGYLYGQARYLYPSAGMTFDWRPERYDRLVVVLKATTYLPIFHAWDEEESTFVDQLMVSVSIGLRVLRPPPAERSAADAPAPDSTGAAASTDG